MNQIKPSIETNWDTLRPGGSENAEKELAEKKNDPEALSRMQNNWNSTDSLNTNNSESKDSPRIFDPQQMTGSQNRSPSTTNLQSLQNQMNGTRPKTESNYDYLVSTGQAQNFRKLSSDPNYQVPAPVSPMNQPSIDAVPSVPKPVNSNMSVETLRQIEQQRVNAIPKPDFRELNSRIPDPGARRF
jgi:hypothetical protein